LTTVRQYKHGNRRIVALAVEHSIATSDESVKADDMISRAIASKYIRW
jgi:hypothetical protein